MKLNYTLLLLSSLLSINLAHAMEVNGVESNGSAPLSLYKESMATEEMDMADNDDLTTDEDEDDKIDSLVEKIKDGEMNREEAIKGLSADSIKKLDEKLAEEAE